MALPIAVVTTRRLSALVHFPTRNCTSPCQMRVDDCRPARLPASLVPSEPPFVAKPVDLGLLLEDVKDGGDISIPDVTMGDAHLGPLVPQDRVHGLHGTASRLVKQ
jgi:hypothetical protein